MNISIFGLGYIGCVTAACLAQNGHHVIGVDVNQTKVNMVNEGRSPIVEGGLKDLICEGVQRGRLRATTDVSSALAATDLSLICVGTPGNGNGSLDLKYIRHVTSQIGRALADKPTQHTVIVRSTMLPGTSRDEIIPLLEKTSEKPYGEGFDFCVNPEFLREGSAIEDFFNPPKIVIGADHTETAWQAMALYTDIDAPRFVTGIEVAEMIKYADNAFHALKVTFANEIGNLCQRLGLDSHEVMHIFCADNKLNLSSYYLKPGFAFGGSCLPKDVSALVQRARSLDLHLPVLEAIMPSNALQIRRAADMIMNTGRKRIGFLGFSFKAGTDDLRNSPIVEVIETLLGKGYQLKIFDENVSLARLHGANREFIEREIPHVSSLMCQTLDEVIESCDVLVIGTRSPLFVDALNHINGHHTIIDLVRIIDPQPMKEKNYHGICW
ncbi:MAG: UDP-glucose/GDP-mannose dehydrogenase family protein [Acidobacteria bacterium]|nr:UDP-glucose/GDP-mannose dehydrogenase family protein [Acidobacteriota bacterium]